MKTAPIIVAAAVLIGGGYAAWQLLRPRAQQAPAPAPVPVSVAGAKEGEVSIYLRTIGAVKALNSVDIKPQVGGVLIQVPGKEGDEVKKDDVLAVIDPRPLQAALDKAQAQLTQDQAQLANATLDQKRYATLATRDFASRQQLDTQTATVNRLQGVVAADQASIDEARINLGFAVLKAPFDGRIGIRRVDPGNLMLANSTQAILTLVQDRPISVLYSIPETDLPKVRDALKQGELVTIADAPGEKRELGQGKLVSIDNAVNSNSGTIQLRSDFPNTDMALTPGQFVNVRLRVGSARGVIVPHLAVQHGTGGLFVFSVKPDKTVERNEVTLAYDDGDTAVISAGLEAGVPVVTAGQSRVGTGIKVAANEARGAPARAADSRPAGQP